jgi:membrane-bound lytic murein transglycosylase MltF
MEKKYHKNSLHGYCRGTEPVEYIQKVMSYYDILKVRDFSVSQPVEVRVD